MKVAVLPLRVGTMYQLQGSTYAIRDVQPDGMVHLACPIRRDVVVPLSVTELVKLRMSGQAKLVGEPEPEVNTALTKARALKALSPEQRARVSRRVAYVNAARSLWPVGPLNPRLSDLISAVAARRGELEPPSPHSVYRWLSRFVRTNDTGVFMRDAGYPSLRKPRIDPTAKAVLQGHLEVLLGSRPGETLWAITDLALALTARDLGFSTFIDKEGNERPVDETVETANSALRAKAAKLPKPRRKTRTKQTTNVQ